MADTAAEPIGADDKEGKLEPRLARQKSKIERCVAYKRDLIPDWSVSIDYRRGKPFDTDSDSLRVPINKDWPMTLSKQAQLFSQVPEVRLKEKHEQYKSGMQLFSKRINDTLCRARVGVAMDETLVDCINAAGVAAVIVNREVRTVRKKVATVPPEVAAQMQAQGVDVPMQEIPQVVASRTTITRISPADLLWDIDFGGSDFDDCALTGRSGRVTWAEAKSQLRLEEAAKNLGMTLDELKRKVLGGDSRQFQDRLINDYGKRSGVDRYVEFDEAFYPRYLYHEDEPSFETYQHVVFVRGLDEPVIDEPWKGQKLLENGEVAGSCKRPVRFLTLAYLSDEAIPPSDSAIIRHQVDELICSRTDAMEQRRASKPMRWGNTNMLDPLVAHTIMRGAWQGIIPVNGSGEKAIGEVARASYPSEDWRFDEVISADIAEMSQTGPEQSATQIRSAREAEIRQGNFQTRTGYTRSRVIRYFLGIAEVVAGYEALFGNFSQEEVQQLGGWDPRMMANYYVYSTFADASVLLDASQRFDRSERLLNIGAKSGVMDVTPLLEDMSSLSGFDPEKLIKKPEPKPPEPANISLRGDATALGDPFVIAMLVKSGQAPGSDEIEAAKKLLLQANAPPQPPQQPGAPGQPQPSQPPIRPGEAMPDYDEATRVNKRSEAGQ